MNFKSYFQLIYYRIRYKYQDWKLKLRIRFSELNRKGRERLTIMVIPHSEDRTINFHISYRAISIFTGSVIVLLLVSAVNVLSHSSSIHELTELNLSNKDFIRQSAKMKEEVKQLHGHVDYYYDRLSKLYIRLGGDPSKIAQGVGGDEVAMLDQSTPQTSGSPENVENEVFHLKEDIHNLKVSNELTEEIIKILKKRKDIIKQTPSVWPTQGYVLYPYGQYLNTVTGKEEYNRGIDIGTFPGSPVVATAPGTVYEIGHSEDSGFYVKVSHKFGWKTIYSNMSRLTVKTNQKVSKEDTIGFVGKSRVHPGGVFHYEIHVGTNTIDPFPFLNQIQN